MKAASANLDLLRSVAVTLVFISHLLVTLGLPWQGTSVGLLGNLGVLLFFIHTSLVLMMSLARLEQGEGSLVRRFYIRRAFRIYPLAILAVLLAIVLRVPEAPYLPYRTPGAAQVWSNILLIQNITQARSVIAPLWSLPFEVQMYLLLPFVYLVGKRINQPLVLLGAGFALWYAEHRLAMKLGYESLLSYAPWFFMGAAAYFRHPARRLPFRLYAVSLALFVAGELVLFHFARGYRFTEYQWAPGVGLCLVLPMFREIQNDVARRIFHIIAKYSYGVYLSHLPIMWLCFVKLTSQPLVLRVALAAVLVCLIPVILYHSVEEPFITWGARLAAGTRRIAAPGDQRVATAVRP